jgi:peptide subunit release factor 1 (eRF1)
LTERNMREIVNFSSHFFSEKNIRRIIIGGTDENIALYKNMLPKSWQSLIVGTFHMSMTASTDEILDRALQIGRQAEHKQAMQMIDIVLTNTAKKKGGVHHLDETLQAVHDGRVQILVVSEGFRAAGKQCTGCGFLTARAIEACPYCNQKFQNIPDAVELAVRRVMQQGGDVEFNHHERALKELGGIGAILRY